VLPAIVLAAGESSRMGSPKAALLTREGRPFIAAIVDALSESGRVAPIVVVTGTHHDDVVDALGGHSASIRVVRNEEPSRGQLSSLWVGMDAAIGPDTPAVLVTLVDVPNIAPPTIRAVVGAWRQSRAPIVRPAIGERHGHPVLFDRSVFEELRRAPLEEGAKVVVRAHASEVLNVPVSDPGCLVDVDTPEDYQRMR
jgi:CTP:molybdopterin cytidylyltransferase MocA